MTTTDSMRTPVRPDSTPPPTTSRPWAWLLFPLGVLLLSLTTFQSVVAVAGWLAPILLLRFVRTHRRRVALPLVAVGGYVATLIAMRDMWGLPQLLLLSAPGLTIVLAYAADSLAAGRLGGVTRTLVFPAVDTAAAFLLSLSAGGAFGSWGATGYTQVTNLPLSQLSALGGVWAVGFVVAWAAPVVNHVWETGFDLRAARRVVAPFCVVLVLALLYGGARLAFSPQASRTVQAAGLSPDHELDQARVAGRVRSGPRSAVERERLHERFLAPVLDELFQRTQTAARAGAEIVAWSEAAGYTFKEDEAALLQRAAAVARAESIYLEVGLVVILPTAGPPQVENRSVLLGPDGATLWDYDKATLVPGDGNLPGKDALPVVSTPFGRLSAVICFDADFPWLVRQAGKAGVDVLLVPSSDWGPVGGVHADMAAFRAIENGVSILRPTRQGRSVAFDPYGRTLARLDTLQAEQQTMTVTLPARRVATGYAVLGDLVGWGSTAVVLVLAGAGVVGLVRRRRADHA